MPEKVLEGLKVLEYAHFISGPFCARFLAGLGAEVIKIEEPGIGDPARTRPPFLQDTPNTECSGLFLSLNNDKLGITLNVRTPTGKEIFNRLIQDTDILIENNPPKVMAELGLDYGSLKKINSRLVMTSITPFGQTGPYRDYNAYDLNLWHIGGTGYQHVSEQQTVVFQGQFTHKPLKGPRHQADLNAGIYAATATMCALYAREEIGIGQHVDISEQEAVATTSLSVLVWSYMQNPGGGPTRQTVAPITLLTCKDGLVHLWIQEEPQWERLVEFMGNPDWAKEEIFQTLFSRGQNFPTLEVLLCDWSSQWTVHDLYHEAQARRIPIMPVNKMEDLFQSSHLQARGFFVELEHPIAGKLKYPGAPFKMSKTPWKMERAAPLLGEHNEEIYSKRLGYSKEDLVRMKGAGVI